MTASSTSGVGKGSARALAEAHTERAARRADATREVRVRVQARPNRAERAPDPTKHAQSG
eukprot:6918895-Alexandrium_andersonii.AAC.1